MTKAKLHNLPLSFTKEQLQKIDRTLLRLADHIAAPLVMVSDISGQLFLYRGRLSASQSTGLSALAAGGFIAGREVGNFLGLREQNSFHRQLLEGRLANLYIVEVGLEILLITVFTEKTSLGMVRLFTEQARETLLELVEEANIARQKEAAEAENNRPGDEFKDETKRQLDELFDTGL